jgi:hypothetical protein
MDLDETQQLPRPSSAEQRMYELKLELEATFALLEKQLEAKTPAERARIERHLKRWQG